LLFKIQIKKRVFEKQGTADGEMVKEKGGEKNCRDGQTVEGQRENFVTIDFDKNDHHLGLKGSLCLQKCTVLKFAHLELLQTRDRCYDFKNIFTEKVGE
jgi:hypothetical protein